MIRNVLFVLTDQQRKDSMGCYGHPSARTPNLDGLAQGGLRFENNIVAHPICMPSRMSILTGQHPRNHGLWTNGLLLEHWPLTIAEHLRRQGYRTASIGKIHLSPTGSDARSWESRRRWADIEDPSSQTGPYQGFEHVELTIGHGCQAVAHYGQWLKEKGGNEADLELLRDPDLHEACGVRAIPRELHPSAFVAERTMAFLDRAKEDGALFFAHVSFPDPHHPYEPPSVAMEGVEVEAQPTPVGGGEDLSSRPPHYAARYNGAFGRKGIVEKEKHPGGFPADYIQLIRARTTAMVEEVDRNMGRILDHLKTSGLEEETLVVFTADHGDALGDHGIFGKGPYTFRSVINTPLLIKGPGLARGVSDAVVSDVDLAPTICSLLDADPLPHANGMDLSDHLRDTSAPTRDFALLEHRNGFGEKDVASAALVGKDETYIRYQNGEEELNDLKTDPQEFHSHHREKKERVMELRTQLLDTLLATQQKGPEQISHA